MGTQKKYQQCDRSVQDYFNEFAGLYQYWQSKTGTKEEIATLKLLLEKNPLKIYSKSRTGRTIRQLSDTDRDLVRLLDRNVRKINTKVKKGILQATDIANVITETHTAYYGNPPRYEWSH
jgi:hypothetical protein